MQNYKNIIELDHAADSPENEKLKELVASIRAKGTINLKGKEYLQVAYRVYLFRLFNPEGCVVTGISSCGKAVIAKAFATENSLKPLGSCMKEIKFNETKEPGKSNPYSMAETGAIGRLLNLLGYGTLGGDLVEDDTNMADGPVTKW